MGKYLHLFDSLNDLKTIYEDSATTVITAFTTYSSSTLPSGTYVYDRYEKETYSVVYYWKNGDVELTTGFRNPYTKEARTAAGKRVYINELLTAPNTPKYTEPWVSYTTDMRTDTFKGTLTQLYGTPEVTLEYAGECNWEYGGFA